MLLYFKTKTCIQIEHSNIKLIFITYLSKRTLERDLSMLQKITTHGRRWRTRTPTDGWASTRWRCSSREHCRRKECWRYSAIMSILPMRQRQDAYDALPRPSTEMPPVFDESQWLVPELCKVYRGGRLQTASHPAPHKLS